MLSHVGVCNRREPIRISIFFLHPGVSAMAMPTFAQSLNLNPVSFNATASMGDDFSIIIFVIQLIFNVALKALAEYLEMLLAAFD